MFKTCLIFEGLNAVTWILACTSVREVECLFPCNTSVPQRLNTLWLHHPQSQLEKLLHYVTCSSHQYDKYWKCMVVEAFLGSGTVFPHPATWEATLGLWKVLRSPHLSLCSSPALSLHWEAWGTLCSQITGHYTYTGKATKAPDNRATEWRYSKALFEMEESDMQRERERRLPFRGLPHWPATSEPLKHLSAVLTRLREIWWNVWFLA